MSPAIDRPRQPPSCWRKLVLCVPPVTSTGRSPWRLEKVTAEDWLRPFWWLSLQGWLPSLANLVSRLFPEPWGTLSAKPMGGHTKLWAWAGEWAWGEGVLALGPEGIYSWRVEEP